MNAPKIIQWILPLAILASPAGAMAGDPVAAEALFNKGVADLKAEKYDTACPTIAESQRLDPRPGTQFTLAECLARWGKVASAVVAYEDYLRAVAALPKAQQARYQERNQIAESQKAALKAQTPELTLVLPKDAPPGVRVTRDDIELSGPSIGLALPVDPGQHIVVVEAPGRPRGEQRIGLKPGEKMVMNLIIPEAPVEKKRPEPMPKEDPGAGADSRGGGRMIGIYAAGGVGVAGLILGGITGGIALGKKSTADEHCMAYSCDPVGLDAVNSGRTVGLLSTIGFAVGAAGVATAAVLWFTRPKEKQAASAPPIQADVAVGERGAMMGVKGVFQ